MKKGPVCLIYYAIKNHRQSKLDEHLSDCSHQSLEIGVIQEKQTVDE